LSAAFVGAASRAARRCGKLSPLIVVLVLDKAGGGESFLLAAFVAPPACRAEAYVGEAGMKAQFKYADRRGAAIAVIEGGDERARAK